MWQFLLGRMIEKATIRTNPSVCLQVRYTQSNCKSCQNACPYQAISIDRSKVEIESERCDQCGICSHVCPTQTFHLESEMLSGYEKKIHDKETACFTCQKQGEDSDIILPCLNVFTPEWIMMATLKKISVQLYWDEKVCKDCHVKWDSQVLMNWIETWNQQFQEQPKFQAQIIHEKSQKKSNYKSISRRDFLMVTKKQVKQQVGSFIFDSFKETSTKEKIPFQQKREVLRQFIQKITPDDKQVDIKLLEQLNIVYITAENSCTLCQRCSMICPTKALQIEKNTYQKSLLFNPIKCINCGICTTRCQHLKQQTHTKISYSDLEQIHTLITKKQDTCPSCGELKNEDQECCEDCHLVRKSREGLLQTLF
ncbi:4Fe-4S dicluster domain-containing protein [Tepidibacillus infernus]|uniref:4Fe-4S dicluster domain-containing protein n=1 Tax=Tepidibacillus infernus TaxID=1806172 RepID=UPI003B695DB0